MQKKLANNSKTTDDLVDACPTDVVEFSESTSDDDLVRLFNLFVLGIILHFFISCLTS